MSLGPRRPAPHACSDDAAVAEKCAAGVATDRAIDYAARRRRAIQRDIIARARVTWSLRLASRLYLGALDCVPGRFSRLATRRINYQPRDASRPPYAALMTLTYARIKRAPPFVRRIIDRTPLPLATPGDREEKLSRRRGNHFCIFACAIPRLRRKCQLRQAQVAREMAEEIEIAGHTENSSFKRNYRLRIYSLVVGIAVCIAVS